MEKTGIRDLVILIFSYKSEKPDAAQFRRWSVILGKFIKPDDEDLRAYTSSEMETVIKALSDRGINLEPEHLFYAGLVSYLVDGRLGYAEPIIRSILDKQDKIDAQDSIMLPVGW